VRGWGNKKIPLSPPFSKVEIRKEIEIVFGVCVVIY